MKSSNLETCYVYLNVKLLRQAITGYLTDAGQKYIRHFDGMKEMENQVEELRKEGVLGFTLMGKEVPQIKRIPHSLFQIIEIRYFQKNSWQGILHGNGKSDTFKSVEECWKIIEDNVRSKHNG